jgi:hypothetical protein
MPLTPSSQKPYGLRGFPTFRWIFLLALIRSGTALPKRRPGTRNGGQASPLAQATPLKAVSGAEVARLGASWWRLVALWHGSAGVWNASWDTGVAAGPMVEPFSWVGRRHVHRCLPRKRQDDREDLSHLLPDSLDSRCSTACSQVELARWHERRGFATLRRVFSLGAIRAGDAVKGECHLRSAPSGCIDFRIGSGRRLRSMVTASLPPPGRLPMDGLSRTRVLGSWRALLAGASRDGHWATQ